MGKFYDRLNPNLIDFVAAQPVFFVASAAATGRINLSPKGMDTFRVLSETDVAYLDLTGSGIETAAHLHADGRLTIMFCAFSGKPLVVRLFGRGSVVRPIDPAWADLIPHFTQQLGQRQIITLKIESVGTSCGFGVPEMEFKRPRTLLADWAGKKGPDGLAAYHAKKNHTSIDGLPSHLNNDESER